MFIELTDHLRCTADHAESFLILLPDAMAGRRVERGSLACPVCGRVVPVMAGVAEFGPPPPAAVTTLTAAAIAAFAGLEGPGGYLALLGGAGALAAELAAALPGIRLVLVNPPDPSAGGEGNSVIRANRLPLKSRTMRAVVVAADHAAWAAAAGAAVLSGNRLIVEGITPAVPEFEPVAEGAGVWIGRKTGRGA